MSLIVPIMKPVLTSGGASTLLNGLLGHWSLNELSGTTFYDDHLNNDLINNGAGLGLPGKIDYAAELYGGGGQSIYSNSIPNLSLNKQITVSGWYYAESYGESRGGRPFILRNSSNASCINNYIYYNGSYPNELSVLYYFSTTRGYWRADDVITYDEWIHFSFLFDWNIFSSTSFRLFRNGVEVSLNTIETPSGAFNREADNIVFGNNTIGGTRQWDGFLDELYIHNRLLTDQEIALLATAPPYSSL